MGAVDDLRDSLRENDGPDTYVVSKTRREGDTHVGEVEPQRLRELLREYPDACRVFEMVTGAGHEHPVAGDGDYSRAEHAGRVETDPEPVITDLSNGAYSCRVRFDTSDPQLATVTNGTTRAQVEIDDTVARLVPPMENS